MQVETLHDPVEVETYFSQRGMRPVWFVWQGRRRSVRQITCAWTERDGGLLYRCFAVTDQQALYELRFDPCALRWWLTKVAEEDGGA